MTLPLRYSFYLSSLVGFGVGSAVQRHAAAPWRAWQAIIPTLMATTQSPDTDSLFSSTPLPRAQVTQVQSTLSQQMNKPSFQLKPLGAALRRQTTQKKQVSTIQRNIHKQFFNSLTDTPTEQAIFLSQSTSHTGAHIMQPSSEAYEIEDRCFRVSVARRLMMPHPAAANPADVVQFCPNKSAAGVICNKPLDPKQHHCYGCRYGGGVDRRHAALARCLADIIQLHSGVKVFIEQEVLALTRVVNGQTEHARMDLVFNLNGSITYLDVSIVAPFSCNPSLVSAASTKPEFMAKRAEKTRFDRYPHINLVPFILETTGRPGPHARKFINYLLRDADFFCVHRAYECKYRLAGNANSPFSPKPVAAVPCGLAATSPRPTMTSTTLTAIFLLLFADVANMPTLLEGLTEVDVLHIALGCRFALDMFTISQRHFPTPDHEPLPHDPELSLF